ncbi:MAG: ATP-binding protein, partial [Candidatus Omnitrophota bacterium]
LGPLDINVIIKDTINSFSVQDMIKNNKVIVDERLFTGLPLIKADGVQLKEVIFNLVINAIQSMPGGGRLTLVTKKEENNLRIEVVDTGSGIPKENMNHLFTPFFTTKSNGLGVGLFVCKEVVELHHGRIEIDTELNKGSTFIVILPNDKK